MGRGALSVCSRYMNAFEIMIRMIQNIHQRIGIIQISLVRRGTNAMKHWQLSKKIIDDLAVLHLRCKENESEETDKVSVYDRPEKAY